MPSDEVARDTIAAIATPAGRGGIGVVRLSGPRVPEIAARVLGFVPEPRRAIFGRFLDADGALVDEGIALYFPAPHSYTGEAVLELQGHGGPVVMQALLGACLDAGARIAEPGEFTRRAFLEGKLDLAQAEAVADLIDAASRQAARSALRSLGGEFSAAIDGLVARLIELRALIEATLDFPEEEVDGLHRDDAATRLVAVRAALDEVLRKSRQGSLLRSGIHVVLAGRPNVGKSSLLNRLVGVERAIVSPTPGTTRDAIDTPLTFRGMPLTLIDTAGIRRRGRIEPGVEKYSVLRALRAIERADVALLLIDALEGVTAQDAHIAGMIIEKWKSAVLLINKWDAVPKHAGTERDFATQARAQLKFLDFVPVRFISALHGTGVDEVLPLALQVQEERLRRIPTAQLNQLLQAAQQAHAPPSKAGVRLRFYFASQVQTDPPTFLFHVNDPELVHFSYARHLENRIRREVSFLGTPLRLSFRKRPRNQ